MTNSQYDILSYLQQKLELCGVLNLYLTVCYDIKPTPVHWKRPSRTRSKLTIKTLSCSFLKAKHDTNIVQAFIPTYLLARGESVQSYPLRSLSTSTSSLCWVSQSKSTSSYMSSSSMLPSPLFSQPHLSPLTSDLSLLLSSGDWEAQPCRRTSRTSDGAPPLASRLSPLASLADSGGTARRQLGAQGDLMVALASYFYTSFPWHWKDILGVLRRLPTRKSEESCGWRHGLPYGIYLSSESWACLITSNRD